MLEAIEWLRMFIFTYPSLGYVIIFFGAAFGGEMAMIALAFLAAQGVFFFFPLFFVFPDRENKNCQSIFFTSLCQSHCKFNYRSCTQNEQRKSFHSPPPCQFY